MLTVTRHQTVTTIHLTRIKLSNNAGLSLAEPLPLDISQLNIETVATQYVTHMRFTAAVLSDDYTQAQHY